MTTHDFASTLRRRWYVLACATLCTMVGLWAVHSRTISYQGCDTLYLSEPAHMGGSNAYLNENLSLAMTAGMVTQTMMSQPVQQRLQAAGLPTPYQVLQTNTGNAEFPSYTQPSVQVCSSGSNSRAVVRTIAVVSQQFREVLHDMQGKQHVPQKSLITASTLTLSIPLPIFGRPSQAYAGIVLMGVIGGVALALWSDIIVERSRRSNTRHA
jgi:hypothetical protein